MNAAFNLKNIFRALRLPFLSVSVLPFIAGSVLAKEDFYPIGFVLGLIVVIATHLGANLINDYADSKSGVDWRDKRFYGFFGGSKLIQEGVFDEKSYLKAAIACLAAAACGVLLLALLLQDISVAIFFAVIALLAWAYSSEPFQLSYRGLGEIAVFVLFGPALVMGGSFIQTQVFPSLKSFLLSVPFGLLAVAVLFANEVPDLDDDRSAGKHTLVSFVGERNAFIVYYSLVIAAYLFVFFNIVFGEASALSFISFAGIFPAFKAAEIIRLYPGDKAKLMESSRLTIITQSLVSATLLLGVII
jgi:1,4-dihydroxy-2-naphthoate octaprenyltransferase